MSSNQKLFAKTSVGIVNVQNPNLNGTGPTTTIYTAGLDGATVVSISIKALQPTTLGMIRIFVNVGGNNRLLTECLVPAIAQNGNTPAFGTIIPMDFDLQTGCSIVASTQNNETFLVTVSATEWENCSCA